MASIGIDYGQIMAANQAQINYAQSRLANYAQAGTQWIGAAGNATGAYVTTIGGTPYSIYVGTTAATAGNAVYSAPFGTVRVGYSQMRPRKALLADRVFKLIKRCVRREDAATVEQKRKSTAWLATQANANGQTGLYEEMSRQLVTLTLSEKLAQAGFSIYVDEKAVHGFRCRADDMHLTELQNFGRPIPEGPSEKLRAAKKSGLFSRFTVLHAGAAMIKTTAQKIREKDPILFGTVDAHPGRLYYIADWLDEFCHLTLSELITCPEFTGSIQSVEVNEDDLRSEVQKREQLLAETNVKTFRAKEAEAKALEQTKPWWKVW